jgi:hypothetical protein
MLSVRHVHREIMDYCLARRILLGVKNEMAEMAFIQLR